MQSFDCLEFIMKGFDELGIRLNKTRSRKEMEEVYCQTEEHKNKNEKQLELKVTALEKTIEKLESEKY